MNFSFGHAKNLYATHQHPRVLLGPEDLAALRRKVGSGDGRKIIEGIRRNIHPLVERVLKADPVAALLQGTPGRMDFTIPAHLHDMAMVGVLDNDEDTIQAARRALLALPAFLGKPEQLDGTAYGSSAGVYSMVMGFHPLAYDLLYPRLSADERSTYCDWIVNTCIRPAIAAARPTFYKNAGANTPIGVTLPSLIGLLAVNGDPGVLDLTTETDRLISFLEASLHAAINVDGYPEEDIGYGTAIAAFLAEAAEPLRRAGLFDVYAACPRYARVGQAMLHFVQPWVVTVIANGNTASAAKFHFAQPLGGRLPNTGDHGPSFGWREFILARQAAETHDPTLLWLLGTLAYQGDVPLRKGFRAPASALSLLAVDELRKAVHPARKRIPTQFRDRGRGIVAFRSGWDEDATFVVFDGSQRSPAGQGHAHDSCGHFSLSALGECFAIASGRYNIEQSCHNVVLIDGKSGRSTDGEWRGSYYHGNLIEYAPDEFCDFAAVDSSHQHNCYWARRYLGLVKSQGAPAYVWTVEDVNKANDWAEFWWTLNTSPENVIETRAHTATITGWRKGNYLDVHFALPAREAYPKPHVLALTQDVATPSSYKYIPNPHERAKEYKRPADMLDAIVFVRPRLIAKVGGYNGRFMSVMLPRSKGAQPAKVERLPSLDNSLAVKITFADVEDTLIWAYEHNLLEAGDVKARGQWIVVRRSRRTHRVLFRASAAAE